MQREHCQDEHGNNNHGESLRETVASDSQDSTSEGPIGYCTNTIQYISHFVSPKYNGHETGHDISQQQNT
jgi:hypothetical protein